VIRWPPDAISFSASEGERLRSSSSVMAVSANGGTPIPIELPVASSTSTGDVAWSSDGSRLAFVAGRPYHPGAYAGGGDLFVMRADGTHLKRLTSGASFSSPSWSPDSSEIVAVRNQGTELIVLRATGGGLRVISSRRGYYQVPAWSPDGRWIAVQSAPAASLDVESLYLLRPDGSQLHRIPGSSLSEGYPAWSPDGARLAYREGERVWVMNADGTDRTQLTHCHLPCVADFAPAWSPDGRRIAFTRQEAGGGATRIYEVDLRTGRVHSLTPDLRYAGSPSYRPSS
jgi:TolB protein